MTSIIRRIAMTLCLATLAVPVVAQERAYAPEDLRALSYNDQVRVISLEYSEQSNGRRIPDDQLRFYIDQVNRSNWGFSQIKADIAKSLGGTTGPQPVPGGTIRCESTGDRAQTCRTPWPGPSRLVRQLSNAACTEGVTWQSQQGQVYVGRGCRAEFAAAPVTPPVASKIRCDSNGSRYQACDTPWRGRSRLQRQFSDAACTEGQSWGSTPGQVWVSRGCRGEFVQGRDTVVPAPYTVTCSSSSILPTTCAWDRNRGSPYLQQQLSNARCVEGLTWGYNSRGLWVSAGCRARFGAR